MSLSRSPSPQRSGGWSSPGLTTPYNGNSRRSSPIRSYANGGANNVTWATAQARSDHVRGFSPKNQGFSRHFRNLSAKLPHFNSRDYSDKEKLGRGRWSSSGSGSQLQNLLSFLGRIIWRLRLRFGAVVAFLLFILLFYTTPLHRIWRRKSFLGGGEKFVIILAANQGGGVMEWKGPREWAIERDSVKNKKAYAKRWGYELEIVDMSTKKRYAHEWRESWEKVDTIRNTMRKYPKAEWYALDDCSGMTSHLDPLPVEQGHLRIHKNWHDKTTLILDDSNGSRRFWWLDLNTFIMEPRRSLQSHIFNDLAHNTYRDINVYNPLNISHPPTDQHLDAESLSAIGDGNPKSINMMIPQDCGGFNLGSFFVRRSIWTDRLLDIWWDPVHYEQKHMEWEHKEQDALEYMYRNQPWIRPHMAFLPQRKVNSFPPGACGDKGDDPKIHYKAEDRDFVVNMAGCEWGRDCWKEMYSYRQLSYRLNRGRWETFTDWARGNLQREKEEAEKVQMNNKLPDDDETEDED